jgi:hypothetical protein
LKIPGSATDSDIMNINETSALDATYKKTSSSSTTSTLHDRNEINQTFTDEFPSISTSDTLSP